MGGGGWGVGGVQLFVSLNFIILLLYIANVYVYLYIRGFWFKQKSYGLKNFEKIGQDGICVLTNKLTN